MLSLWLILLLIGVVLICATLVLNEGLKMVPLSSAQKIIFQAKTMAEFPTWKIVWYIGVVGGGVIALTGLYLKFNT